MFDTDTVLFFFYERNLSFGGNAIFAKLKERWYGEEYPYIPVQMLPFLKMFNKLGNEFVYQ